MKIYRRACAPYAWPQSDVPIRDNQTAMEPRQPLTDAASRAPRYAGIFSSLLKRQWRERRVPAPKVWNRPGLKICCVKWGDKFGPEYVNILHDMVNRNLAVGTARDFICFTDNADGLDAGILAAPLPGDLAGWWTKLYLFRRGVFTAGDRVLFMDLDTVIVGAIDDIAAYGGEFAILRDFYRPDGWQSSIMAWRGGFGAEIWDLYRKHGCPDVEGGDQAWIEHVVSDADIWQDLLPGQFVSYKVHAREGPPAGARVIVFHGKPRPHEAGGWVPQVWRVGAARHGEPAIGAAGSSA